MHFEFVSLCALFKVKNKQKPPVFSRKKFNKHYLNKLLFNNNFLGISCHLFYEEKSLHFV